MSKILLAAALLVSLFAAVMPRTQAGELTDFFSIRSAQSMSSVDHAVWQRFLSKYVVPASDNINLIAYGRVSAADNETLKAYLTSLQKVKVASLPDKEQQAYWINLYNALTISVVLDHYPVKSIKKISLGGGLFSSGPWKKILVQVEGKGLSLDNIEHDILRKIWHDPRVHYAVNCASMSCPNLMDKPFTSANLDRMLTQGARDYINHSRAVKVSAGRVYLSRIYSWYRDDFGANDAEVLRHLSLYAGSELKAELAGVETISGYDYDWSLNEAK